MTNPVDNANLRIMALQLTSTGCGCLDAAIRSAYEQGRPLDLALLKMARDFEQHSPGCRLSMIRMLDREIRRQEKAQAKAA